MHFHVLYIQVLTRMCRGKLNCLDLILCKHQIFIICVILIYGEACANAVANMVTAGGTSAHWKKLFNPPNSEHLVDTFACYITSEVGLIVVDIVAFNSWGTFLLQVQMFKWNRIWFAYPD